MPMRESFLNRTLGILMITVAFVVMPVCGDVRAGLTLTGDTPIYVNATRSEPLDRAVRALQRDWKKVFGREPALKSLDQIDQPGVVIAGPQITKLPPTVSGPEAHRVRICEIDGRPQVVLEGADERGTIYALYTFSEKVLGVPPFWYFSGWTPDTKERTTLEPTFDVRFDSPQVQYRAWFPNDTDLFTPWRRQSAANNEMWLEAALRAKINTIEWFDNERDYGKPYSVSPTTKLIQQYGLLNTTHHHSPLNASFKGWDAYWRRVRKMEPPALSLANEAKLEDFWRYNIECVVRNKIDMIWVLGFRGDGDIPFWETFKDAPTSMAERGEIISRMLKKQRDLVIEITGDQHAQFRSIFYNEISDLLAQGLIRLPDDPQFIRTYVAARRDHFPNRDVRQLEDKSGLRLGYYFNYQFTSTGSHLAAAEGPWKMEWNFRYVAGKSRRPLAISVVNAGNLREYVMELSANAAMMWDFDAYTSDQFLREFCSLYFGADQAGPTAALYRQFYDAYWTQKAPDLQGLNRQYIFQDLRYKRAIQGICAAFKRPFDPNPLRDVGGEQEPGRTFRIVPADNKALSEVEAILTGTSASAAAFLKVAEEADRLEQRLKPQQRPFFNANLRQPANYMRYLNDCLHAVTAAYRSTDAAARQHELTQALAALDESERALRSTQHPPFEQWYAGDRVFDFNGLRRVIQDLIKAN